MINYKELERNERRTVIMSNTLWNELVKITNDNYSVSWWVRMAILEKLKRDYPKKALYWEEIVLK